MTDPGPLDGPAPIGRSARLGAAIDDLWSRMADDYGLLPDLALDALLARADRGELVAAAPRLVELTVSHAMSVADAAAVVDRFGQYDWEPPERVAVGEALDAWWLETLRRLPGEQVEPYRPEVVLGVVVGFGVPMVRWLGPWLDELDGPGAVHLADVVLGGPDGLSGPAWVGKEDEARQVLAWARTEPVVTGLTLVGGVHLGDGVLGDVLDRLLG
ncbi:MAG: hypothetical protein AAGA93_20045 [Actinomycetota bacterium]